MLKTVFTLMTAGLVLAMSLDTAAQDAPAVQTGYAPVNGLKMLLANSLKPQDGQMHFCVSEIAVFLTASGKYD